MIKKLYAVYLESLDQDLQVFLDEAEAQARLNELEAAGKPVKMQMFASNMISGVDKANGCSARDSHFWEEIEYNNGTCKLIEHFSWHSDPEPEGYYAEYSLLWE